MDESTKKVKKGLLQRLMQLMNDEDDEKLVKIKEGKSPFGGGTYSIYEKRSPEQHEVDNMEERKERPREELKPDPKDISTGQEDELDELWRRKGIKKPD